jgi:triphosphoribosyl-dephospho-CoA synthetase
MSSLDDTCVIHRVGYNRAQEVKEEAKALLDNFSEEGLKEMKKRYDAEGISPGGAADMLALTIFVDSLIN